MLMLRNFHNVTNVFGILATLEEFRVTWLPDCNQQAAESEVISNIKLAQHGNNVLYGTEILSSQDKNPLFHHYIASAILKAYKSEVSSNVPPRPLSDRMVFLVDRSHLKWSTLSKGGNAFTFMMPVNDINSFYLVKDLQHGVNGRAWLAVSNTQPRGSIVVLKMGTSAILKQRGIIDEENSHMFAPEQLDLELSMWKQLGFNARCTDLHGSKALCLPFAITCSTPINGAVMWDTRVWDEVKSYISATERKLVEDALSSITPTMALQQAVKYLVDKQVWHQDISWRHLGIFLHITPGHIYGKYISVLPCFIDYDKATKITSRNSSEAVEDMMRVKDKLLAALLPGATNSAYLEASNNNSSPSSLEAILNTNTKKKRAKRTSEENDTISSPPLCTTPKDQK